MRNKKNRRKLPFLAAFLLLFLFTTTLVFYSILFFSWEPVRDQIMGWGDDAFSNARWMVGESEPTPQPGISIPGVNLPVTLATITPHLHNTFLPNITTNDAANLFVERMPVQKPTPTPMPEVAEGELIIPVLEIDTPLLHVSVENGSWNLAKLGSGLGWLETTGAYPGDDLSMVIAGHVTLPYPPGGGGPFYNLKQLKAGDKITYRTTNALYIYRVDGQKLVPPDGVTSLYQQDGNRLILVTCTTWNAIERHYSQRLLVEATLVRIDPLSLLPSP